MPKTIDENTTVNTSLKMICFLLSFTVCAVLWGSRLEYNDNDMDKRLLKAESKIDSINDLKVEMKGQSTTLIHILNSLNEMKEQIKENAKKGG